MASKNKNVKEQTLNEAVDAILEGVGSMIKESEEKLEHKMDVHRAHTKDDIDGLKAEFANTPSRQEFEDLRKRVQQLEKSQLSN